MELCFGGEGQLDAGEVTITYGPRTNFDLLLLFGFVEPDNPHDVMTLVLDDGT